MSEPTKVKLEPYEVVVPEGGWNKYEPDSLKILRDYTLHIKAAELQIEQAVRYRDSLVDSRQTMLEFAREKGYVK